MGKGFNNYMCKKFFHPASRDNLKRVWMAEQKTDAYKKKQEELRLQYEKEQDLHNNKALLSKESKDKLSVSFMYQPPPGAKKEREREDGEPEFKFEWQRKYCAPREDYCKGNQEIRDQPFGIQVRNVRCVKCHSWGHINTDKECPLYGCAAPNSRAPTSMDPMVLMKQMKEDGLAMKKGQLGIHDERLNLANNQMIQSSDDDEEDDSHEYEKSDKKKVISSLTLKEKQKLLKKLTSLEKREKNHKMGMKFSRKEDKHQKQVLKESKYEKVKVKEENHSKASSSSHERERGDYQYDSSDSGEDTQHKYEKNHKKKYTRKEYSESGEDSQEYKRRKHSHKDTGSKESSKHSAHKKRSDGSHKSLHRRHKEHNHY